MSKHYIPIERLMIHGGLPKVERLMLNKFEDIKNEWRESVNSSNVPGWWKRMLFQSGGMLRKKRTINGFRIYYSDEGKYDYMGIIDKGRPRYNMRNVLFSRLPKHIGKNGAYVVVPLKDRNGMVKFRAMTLHGGGWEYPEIKATNIIQGINEKVKDIYNSKEFIQALDHDFQNAGKSSVFKGILKAQIMYSKRTKWRFL